MTTLFERITGSVDKIPIHGIIGALREFYRGELTKQQIVDEFNLDAQQEADLTVIYVKIVGSSNPLDRLAELFDLCVLAELGGAPEIYNDEAKFWIRINGFT